MRNKRIRTLLAALLIASTLSATAFAETAIVTGSEVNVRSGPGSDYAILGSYTRGSSVDVLDRGDGIWYVVNYNGTAGYMYAEYLSLQADSSAVILPTAPVQPPSGSGVLIQDTPVQTPSGSGTGTVIYSGAQPAVTEQTNGQINAMYVRFRSGPSADSAIVGEYNRGKAVTILGSEGDWTLCCIDGEYGYISSRYVTAVGPVAAAAATPAPSAETGSGIVIGQSGNTVQDAGYGQYIVVSTPAPTPTPTAVTPGIQIVLVTPSPAPEVGSPTVSGVSGTISGDYVRFRRGPGTEYSIIRSYDRGQALTLLGTEGNWSYCRIDGETGYVFSQYVQTVSSSSTASGTVSGGVQTVVTPGAAGQAILDASTVQAPAVSTPAPTSAVGSPGYIKGNNVRFRAGPDLSSEIIGELYYGNAVTITGSDGTWTSLVCEGREGYVFSQYVAFGALPTASSVGTASGREVADFALQYVGTPYHWGGIDPSVGFDCSGFAYFVYQHFGYTLNRVASEQALNGKHVEVSDMQPGDLLCFYSGGSYIGHVGIYIGNNLFVHSATSSTGVITSELTGYYARRGFEVRRIIG